MNIAGLPDNLHVAMERMWLQEIGGSSATLSPQTLKALLKRGYVEINSVETPDRYGVLRIQVPRLTIAGHIEYCLWASAQLAMELDVPPDGNLPSG